MIVPFLVAAFVLLYFWPAPDDTARLFAWRIVPGFTAMVLGSVYLGGSYFFVRAIWANQWHRIAGGFIPIGSFATLMGVATVLHWDKFVHTNLAFRLWAALYFTTPFLVFAVWWANRRERVRPAVDDLQVSAGTARLIGVVGVAAVVTSAFLFLAPSAAIRIWPWTLTLLTARVMGAIFVLGGAGLGTFWDRRWSSARILFQVAGLMFVLDRCRRGPGTRRLRHVQAVDLGVRRRVRGRGRRFGRALRAHGTTESLDSGGLSPRFVPHRRPHFKEPGRGTADGDRPSRRRMAAKARPGAAPASLGSIRW